LSFESAANIPAEVFINSTKKIKALKSKTLAVKKAR
jgi:hypothetical protein